MNRPPLSTGAHPQTPRAIGAGRRSGLWPLSSNNHFSHHFGCFFEDTRSPSVSAGSMPGAAAWAKTMSSHFRPCRCGRLRWPVAHRHRLELLHFPRPDRRRPSCRLPLSRRREASAGPQDSDGLFRWGCGQRSPLRLTDAHPLRSCAHGKRVPGFQREPGLLGVPCGEEGHRGTSRRRNYELCG